MFYLELKDGDKFLTDKDSDDRREFEKILNDKLGRDAAELFDSLVKEDESNAEHLLHTVANRYRDCVNALDKALNENPVNQAKLEEILADFQAFYTDYLL